MTGEEFENDPNLIATIRIVEGQDHKVGQGRFLRGEEKFDTLNLMQIERVVMMLANLNHIAFKRIAKLMDQREQTMGQTKSLKDSLEQDLNDKV